MRTDLIKFERGTIGFKCLNKEKDGLSKFGVMLNDMNKEIFDDMTIICPCCGSPVKLDLIHINFKKSSMMISKWFSYLAMCSNAACSYQYNAFLKKEFWEEIQINKNKISHTMTFGLSPGTLSLPIDDTYVLQDLLILCKEAGYKKIMFGARNAFNQIKKIGTKNSSYKLDPKKYAKHCYDLSDGFSTNMMTVIGYKDKNKDCKYNNISALSYIFYNILKIGSRKDTKDAETKKQSMQHFYVSYLPKNVKIVGITGSNGKTTTKDMVYSVLSQKYRCKKTEGNYNNHIGLPFTILQLEDGDEIAVLEMGMSGFGEIDKLCEISSPDYGIITNIGDSHLEFLKTRENVFKAKGEMIKYISEENLIVYGDDFYLRNLVGLTVGFGDNCKEQIRDFQDMESGLEFMLDGENYHVGLNGKHNCLNAAMSVVIGKKLKIDSSLIQKGFQNLELTPMRFQKIEKDSIIYINDAYNASPISMNYSLETFDKLYNEREKIVVLGDMLELGENEIEYHKQVLEKALSIRVDKIYIYGERMKKAQSLLENSDKIEHFQDKKRISEKIKKSPLERKAVLLKGSRGMKMEEIIEG